MHIIIPMSGIGKRFIDAGYDVPKPLIEIDGKRIIEHVCDLFPGETKFTFICNSKHIEENDIKAILLGIRPGSTVVEIPNHKKGPVYAVSLIENLIDDNEEIIVNYCDFGTYWDYSDFLKHTRGRNADGAIPSYRGFHPHMLGSTNYAFMREENQFMLEIKEKEPFTENRNQEFASNGTYYFKKGAYVKKYFKELMDKDINLNGEFYVSLIYNLLVRDNLKVSIYEIQHMLQWGTPQDVEEYNIWSKYFRNAINEVEKPNPKKESVTLIPLAGRGSRFSNQGYSIPKPMIPVGGKPMIIQAANSLPKSESQIFVTLDEHLKSFPLKTTLRDIYPDCKIVAINEVTQGQAITCSLGLDGEDEGQSLLIAPTDNGMIYNHSKYEELISSSKVDAIVFTFRNHVSSRNNPEMYGWVKTDKIDNVTDVSVKVPISDDPYNDHAIVGTFYFRKISFFNKALKSLIKKNITVNGEFYVDSMIKELLDLGLKVKFLEVEDYIGWGTPNDYETYVYWQSFFHKVEWHPYSMEKDLTVNKDELAELDKLYRNFNQSFR